MRRLMWNLNDESGGIGWGNPEAMGEILACHEALANEYAPISYPMHEKMGTISNWKCFNAVSSGGLQDSLR